MSHFLEGERKRWRGGGEGRVGTGSPRLAAPELTFFYVPRRFSSLRPYVGRIRPCGGRVLGLKTTPLRVIEKFSLRHDFYFPPSLAPLA